MKFYFFQYELKIMGKEIPLHPLLLGDVLINWPRIYMSPKGMLDIKIPKPSCRMYMTKTHRLKNFAFSRRIEPAIPSLRLVGKPFVKLVIHNFNKRS